MTLKKLLEPWLIDFWIGYKELQNSCRQFHRQQFRLHSNLRSLKSGYKFYLRNNDEKYFAKQVNTFPLKEVLQYTAMDSSEMLTIVVEGWRSGVAGELKLHKLSEGLPFRKIIKSRIFRPDVFYQKPSVGLFSGFEIHLEVTAGNVSPLLLLLEQLSAQLTDKHVEIAFKLDGHRFDFKRGGFEFILANYSYELAELLEWRIDRHSALKILDLIGERTWLVPDEVIVRFNLVGQGNCLIADRKWKVLARKTPNWITVSDSVSVRVPKSIHRGRSVYFSNGDEKVISPPGRIACILGARITKGGTVFDDNFIYDIEEAANPTLGFVSGRWDHVVGSSANFTQVGLKLPEEDPVRIESGILLGGRNDANWFHLLIEYLPKIFLLDAVPEDVPLLINERWPASAIDALELLTNRNIVKLDSRVSQYIRRLYVPGATSYHPDNVNLLNKPQTWAFHLGLVAELRKTILASAQLGSDSPRRVYFARPSGARSVSNLKAVDLVFSAFGFEKIDPLSLSLLEQVRLFQSASAVVFPGGAAMANLIFSNSYQKVLMLCSADNSEYKVPHLLASISGADVRLLKGRSIHAPRSYSWLMKLHRHYRVPLASLALNLYRLTRS